MIKVFFLSNSNNRGSIWQVGFLGLRAEKKLWIFSSAHWLSTWSTLSFTVYQFPSWGFAHHTTPEQSTWASLSTELEKRHQILSRVLVGMTAFQEIGEKRKRFWLIVSATSSFSSLSFQQSFGAENLFESLSFWLLFGLFTF